MNPGARTAIVTAWNNGQHHESGAGYGFKIDATDRDRLFGGLQEALLQLEDVAEPVRVNLAKKSFWGPHCRELIKQEIGLWLRDNGRASWPERQPPRFLLTALGGNRFKVGKHPRTLATALEASRE